MKRSQWNENDIEELLKNLPNIKDRRHPKDIYQNIESRIHRKRSNNWIPLIAAMAALFVLAVLATSIMLGSNNSASEDRAIEKTEMERGSQSRKAASSQHAGTENNSSSTPNDQVAKSEDRHGAAEEKPSEEEVGINHGARKAYFIYQTNESSRKMLVSSHSEFPTIDKALEEMIKGSGDPSISPSIPKELKWDRVEEQDKKVILELSEGTKISDTEEYLTALEAILLTAKDFGFDYVKFSNANIDALGPYNLQEDVPVPIAPNKIN
ncbi:hypothetical protein ELQ35_09885 [Peribacillus cavernae]|uniref:Uncharacterized protein n=1 Tax=Peribacillus cavernae TaxID=1674310 RepID=A0A433HLL1_9BACI|nr:GerMN domain-containing protein [Peribacillus cavernae]MDQ0219028.1 hypothetical protein [Peribacillus cavernae]RUQ29266.1 hypothetical protein ELQ35_09885 [Peribacillus cavernae]